MTKLRKLRSILFILRVKLEAFWFRQWSKPFPRLSDPKTFKQWCQTWWHIFKPIDRRFGGFRSKILQMLVVDSCNHNSAYIWNMASVHCSLVRRIWCHFPFTRFGPRKLLGLSWLLLGHQSHSLQSSSKPRPWSTFYTSSRTPFLIRILGTLLPILVTICSATHAWASPIFKFEYCSCFQMSCVL